MTRITRRRQTAADFVPEDASEEFFADTEAQQEDEAPTRGSRRGARRASLPAQRTAPVQDDEDDEEETPRTRARKASEDTPKAQGGWGTFNKQKSESGDFPENLKVTDEQTLIKFLEDEPFVVYKQHWIERQGKKSFTCLEDGCPLCDDLGDRPRLQVAFNVVDLSGDPEVKIWTVGTRVAGQLKAFSQDKKTSPLNKDGLYWGVSKTGKGSKTTYAITPVKERDLVEDWELEPLTEDELDALGDKAYGPDTVQYQTKKQLREVSDEALDD